MAIQGQVKAHMSSRDTKVTALIPPLRFNAHLGHGGQLDTAHEGAAATAAPKHGLLEQHQDLDARIAGSAGKLKVGRLDVLEDEFRDLGQVAADVRVVLSSETFLNGRESCDGDPEPRPDQTTCPKRTTRTVSNACRVPSYGLLDSCRGSLTKDGGLRQAATPHLLRPT